MKYLDLAIVNEQIKTTDIKGKEYAEVNQRIKAFRMLYPNGTIETKMISNDDGVCIFEAKVYSEPQLAKNITIDGVVTHERYEKGVLLATGTAYEKEDSTFINKTSYIENCETSAVGRALGMAGFGIDVSVASAEEVANAIQNQEVTKEDAYNYKFTFGRNKGKTIKEVQENDPKWLDWFIGNTEDERTLQMIELATGKHIPTEEESNERIKLIADINELERELNVDHEEVLDKLNVESLNQLTIVQLKECKSNLEKVNK